MSGERSAIAAFLRRSEPGLLAAIVVVVAAVAALDAQHNYWYRPWPSAVDILRQTSMLGIFALGAAIVIIAGGIDLSSGSVIAFSGTLCATFMILLAPHEMRDGMPLPTYVLGLSIVGTLVGGLLIGSLHAWLITVIGLPPFIATLATLVGLRSLGRAIVENATESLIGGRSTQIQIYDEQFRYLATSVWIPAVLFFLLAAVLWLMMNRTVVGRHLYALGGNEAATRLSGIRTDRLKWLAYSLAAVLSSLAGILYISDQSVANPQNLGRGYELNAIAAAVVGGCSLAGGVGTIPGVVLGCFFLRIVVDGTAKMIKANADTYEGLIVGILVVLAVAFNQLRTGLGQGRQLFPGWLGAVTVINLALLGSLLVGFAAGVRAGATVGGVALVILGGVKLVEVRHERQRRGEARR